MAGLFISSNEAHTVPVAIVLDITIDLIREESLDCIVELVLVEVQANIADSEVRPVGMLKSTDQTVVLGDPETVLDILQVD